MSSRTSIVCVDIHHCTLSCWHTALRGLELDENFLSHKASPTWLALSPRISSASKTAEFSPLRAPFHTHIPSTSIIHHMYNHHSKPFILTPTASSLPPDDLHHTLSPVPRPPRRRKPAHSTYHDYLSHIKIVAYIGMRCNKSQSFRL